MDEKVRKAIEQYAQLCDDLDKAIAAEKAATLNTTFVTERRQEAWRHLKSLKETTEKLFAYRLADGRVLLLGGPGEYPQPIQFDIVDAKDKK